MHKEHPLTKKINSVNCDNCFTNSGQTWVGIYLATSGGCLHMGGYLPSHFRWMSSHGWVFT